MNTKENIQKDFDEIVNGGLNSGKIYIHWASATPLFAFIGNREDSNSDSKYEKGCLTQIKNYPEEYSPFINGKECLELKKEILEDNRIVTDTNDLKTPEDLLVFKEYQDRVVDMQEAGYYIPKSEEEDTKVD